MLHIKKWNLCSPRVARFEFSTATLAMIAFSFHEKIKKQKKSLKLECWRLDVDADAVQLSKRGEISHMKLQKT